MRFRFAALAAVALSATPVSAQEPIPVVPATSRVVTITDGRHVKKDAWYVMPERSPDVYYVEVPLEPHRVIFTTDRGSASFDVTFGSRHDFVIRLADGRDALTQVRAEFRNLLSSRRTGPTPANGVDTIPFTLGDNDKIYLKARVNGGPPLDAQFDLGAGGSLIKKASVSKVSMQFDGSIRLRNSDGEQDVPSSSANRLDIAGLAWDTVGFAVADNMTEREDLLLGNALFQDKVVEIDYDRMVIAIHDALPALPGGWTEVELFLDGVVPFARGTLAIDGVDRAGWFMLDTGAYTSILNSDRLSAPSKFARELRRMIGWPAHGPAISIAGRTLEHPNYSVRRYDGDATALGLLGNDVLKRFNLILDNRRGRAYLRSNGRAHDPFRNPERLVLRAASGAMVVGAAVLAWRIRRRPRRSGPVLSDVGSAVVGAPGRRAVPGTCRVVQPAGARFATLVMRSHMSPLRIPTLTCIAVLTAQVAAASPAYTQYRGVSIGDSPGTVVAALKMTPADVVVVTARPTLVEQVTWRPNQFFTGRTGPADDLWEMVLTFNRGRLARIVATYERDRTAGMTDADLHAAFTATYGTAMLVPTPTAAGVAGEPVTIGRWGDAETLVVLWREDYPRRIHVSISSVAEDRTMQEAVASGKRLDAIEAPARDIVRRATEDFTARQRTAKIRSDNNATFKP